MNLSLAELPLPVHLRPEMAMTDDEFLRFCAANDTVRIEREPNGAWVELLRWQALTKDQQQRFAPLCPDFILELRSPSDTLAALHRKMQQWTENGAQLAWLIDPVDRDVTVYRPGETPEQHPDPTSLQGTGPVAGFVLVLSRLWGK